MSKRLELGQEKITDEHLIGILLTAVNRCRAASTGDGDVRMGEVAIYKDQSGCYAAQLRFRDGRATECGRHPTLRDAIGALSGAPQPQQQEKRP